MPLETTRFDIQDHLKTHEDRLLYLEAAFDDGDPALIAHALGDVARTVDMTSLAKDVVVARQVLYEAPSETGDPRLSTVLSVIKALGLKISVVSNKEPV
ncbi:addiction module antidote protein [Rhizobium metallidurans]|uniref:Putative addiction module antidote protein n=1 Tax=Rhizobium metallidurans TaxID=1265931 RepID=A0A7W6GBW0_9HYPH|nr:addiction module antidote protein [Rhizobium metallidurans]MBB3964016.1 putative addiction module antidote protein [Rhizobium metallidurans]